MNASLAAVLNDNERELVAETEPAQLAPLVRRATNLAASIGRPSGRRRAKKGIFAPLDLRSRERRGPQT